MSKLPKLRKEVRRLLGQSLQDEYRAGTPSLGYCVLSGAALDDCVSSAIVRIYRY